MTESYIPISDYGLIGNTRTAALVSKQGSLDWCCFPRFDSPSFFCAILDAKKGGQFSITSKDKFESRQSYLKDTNVLETIFVTNAGTARILDCFPVDSEENKRGELWPLHEILRVVEGTTGEVEFEMNFNPKTEYGLKEIKISSARKFGLRCDLGKEVVHLNHDLDPCKIKISPDKDKALATFKVHAGERVIFSLTYSDEAPATVPPLGTHALERLERTVRYWKSWISHCKYQGPYVEDVKRSALALKLLVFSPSGAVVAAPTTSLPEGLKGERNWDYRYCWLRDASFTIRALVGLGFQEEANAYVGWILHTTTLTRPRVEVLYTIYGEARIPEHTLPWLAGYEGSRPVRTGNAADVQFQLDVYGEVMNGLYIFAPFLKTFDKDTVTFFTDIGNSICELWHLPDEGIWEVRSGRTHHTHSKAMAWVALDRLIRLCETYEWKAPVDEYKKTASLIKQRLELYGYNEKLESYTVSFDSDEIDASLLMLSLMDYEPTSSERIFKTIQKIQKDLSKNGLLYRYINRDDGVRGNEGAFLACSFWLVESLVKAGKPDEARKIFEDLLKRKNETGLWPEEINPESNQYLGNYPQAFTHTALIGAALSMEKGPSHEH